MIKNFIQVWGGIARDRLATLITNENSTELYLHWVLLFAFAAVSSIVPSGIFMASCLFAAFTILWSRQIYQNFTASDVSVLLIVCSYGLSTVLAPYKPSSTFVTSLAVSGASIYFIVRFGVRRFGILAPLVTFLSLLYTTVGLYHFVHSFLVWRQLDFKHLVDFRAYVNTSPVPIRGGDPNGFFLAGLGFALIGLSGKRQMQMWARVTVIVVGIGCTTCLLLSFSRAAYVALFAGALCFIGTSGKRRSTIMSTITFAGIVCVLCIISRQIALGMFETLELRATNTQVRSYRGRKGLAEAALLIVEHRPVLGVGPGNFLRGLKEYAPYLSHSLARDPYSYILTVAAENGLFGVVGIMALAASIIARLRIHSINGPRQYYASLIFCCSSLGFYATLQNFVLSGRCTSIYMAVLLALIVNHSTPHVLSNDAGRTPQTLRTALVIMAAIGLTSAPYLIDREIRDLQIELFPSNGRSGRNSFVRTLFRTQDPYVDFANEVIRGRSVVIAYNAYDQPVLAAGKDESDQIRSLNSVVEGWQKVVRELPLDYGGWDNLARAYAMVGRRDDAIAAALKAVDLAPQQSSPVTTLALLQISFGNDSAAEGALSKAVALNPLLAESRFWMELSARSPGMTSAAVIDATARVDSIYSHYGDPLQGERLARLLWLRGERRRSQKLLDSVLSVLPNLEGAWLLRGEIYEQQNAITQSKLCYERAIFLQPADAFPHERLAAIAFDTHDFAAASSLTMQALNLRRGEHTQHALEAKVEYGLQRAIANDAFPTSWIFFISPFFDFERTLLDLAAQAELSGETRDASWYRALAGQQLFR